MSQENNLEDFELTVERSQASSHPELTESQPDELFEAAFVTRYCELHADLWERIVRLNGTIRTLEQLRGFPFECIYGNEMEFWRLVIRNFVDIAIVMLHALVNDTSGDINSLPSFRRVIINAAWQCEDKRKLLMQTLEERKFDHVVKNIADRVNNIRHNYVAHRLVDPQTGSPKQIIHRLNLEQVRKLFNAAHAQFGAFSFGSVYGTLAGDLVPATIGGKRKPTCLDRVLDAVLRDSDFVNMPEHRAESWPIRRTIMPPEKLKLLNELRRRIGLTEA